MNPIACTTPEQRRKAIVQVYLDKLRQTYGMVRRSGYAASYPIATLDGNVKYHLVFACGSDKGFVLASNVVCDIEHTYQVAVKDYTVHKTQQPVLPQFEPTEQELFDATVGRLRDEVWLIGRGNTKSRRAIHAEIISQPDWFGTFKAKHMTKALERLEKERKILNKTGTLGKEETVVTFTPS